MPSEADAIKTREPLSQSRSTFSMETGGHLAGSAACSTTNLEQAQSPASQVHSPSEQVAPFFWAASTHAAVAHPTRAVSFNDPRKAKTASSTAWGPPHSTKRSLLLTKTGVEQGWSARAVVAARRTARRIAGNACVPRSHRGVATRFV